MPGAEPHIVGGQAGHAAMRHHHPLGGSGRAGGVHDVGQVIGGRRDGRVGVGALRDAGRVGVEQDDRPVERRQSAGQRVGSAGPRGRASRSMKRSRSGG